MAETPRDIPEQEQFSTSDERSEFMGAANFDPAVVEALAHMEDHEDKLESEARTELDAVLDEYSETLKLLTGDVDPATRTRLEAERDALREKISGTKVFDQEVERELAGAGNREASLFKRSEKLMDEHPVIEGLEPVNPATEGARLFTECRRVRLLAQNLFLKTEKNVVELPTAEQPAVRNRLDVLRNQLLGSSEDLVSAGLDTRYPEEVPLEVWESSLTKFQDSLEEIILANRDVAERKSRATGLTKNRPPEGSIQERPS